MTIPSRLTSAAAAGPPGLRLRIEHGQLDWREGVPVRVTNLQTTVPGGHRAKRMRRRQQALSAGIELLLPPTGSLNSSPRGAGRTFSRSAARREFTHEQLREAMVGIEFRDTDAFIDEILQAYKPIDQVMADASSLVTIRHTLHQIVNVKGD